MCPRCSCAVQKRGLSATNGIVSVFVAGGASVSWKDKVRITMTARLKLLVKFKQAFELGVVRRVEFQ